ncbi:hypothetical protein [Streptomyces sp. NPDC054804]
MSSPTPRERLAGSGESPDAELLGAWARIERTLQEIASFETNDVCVIALLLRLTEALEGPAPLADLAEPPYPLTADIIRRLLADALTASWPRMAHDGHADDVADSLMSVVLPIVSLSRDVSFGWRGKAVRALDERDRARAAAVALEQLAAEAARLLRVGLPGQALAVLESDGRPLGPCAAPGLVDDTAPSGRPLKDRGADNGDPRYVDTPGEGVWLPERMFVVTATRRCSDGDFAVLDLHGAYPLVEDANGRARDLVLELSPADPAVTTNPVDGSVAITVPPNGSFTGLVEVVELKVDPYSSESTRMVQYKPTREDTYAPDGGRGLDGEE